jgi:hypothetical protein
MPDATRHSPAPAYGAGDVLVSPSAGDADAYDVSRVSANGRSTHVMGVQATQFAALQMAARATSGFQRVFLQSTRAGDFQQVSDRPARG